MRDLDVGTFRELMEESQDLQVDAMRGMKEPLDEIVEAGRARRATREYRDSVDEVRARQREYLRSLSTAGAGGLTAAGVAAGLVLATGSRAFAAEQADIQALQTAASLENLAVFTYKTALTLPYLKKDDTATKTIAAFAQMTQKQHDEHAQAFNARVAELGGQKQTETNPKYTPIVQEMVPKLKSGGPLDVVGLAITLEDVATSTYVKNIQEVTDPQVRLLFGTIAGVESQHLATLYAVQALLKGDATDLITVKSTGGAVNAAKLPAETAQAAIPEVFKKTELASPPSEGAVQ